MKHILTLAAALVFAAATGVTAQNLDGSPYNPETDPDIDMFMKNWSESMPVVTHGSMVERPILTRGNQLDPPTRGAVLEFVNRFSYASLPVSSTTGKTTLTGEQEVYYVVSGTGTIEWSGEKANIDAGACILIPEGLEFTMMCTGEGPLNMYVVCEPTYAGFTPSPDVVIRDNDTVPFNKTIGHWSYLEKDLILGHHGLAVLHAVITLTLDPMTIGHPHTHIKGTEEVWTTVSGDNIAWLGKELRPQPAGTAYMIPPDGKTNHSNINKSETEPVLMLYFSVRHDLKK